VVITEGAATKMLVLDKPLTITLGHEGKAPCIGHRGQGAPALKGEPLRLEIKSGILS
jgi:hypothetical protein